MNETRKKYTITEITKSQAEKFENQKYKYKDGQVVRTPIWTATIQLRPRLKPEADDPVRR